MTEFDKTLNEDKTFQAYRFVKVNGVMTKIDIKSVDAALEEALKIRHNRKKNLDKELLINGVTSKY
ncbi:hypothetical protein [Vibrio splendidus]|jgi:hypothetical protein|uniref:hypothetical protein n=1 Tax=Vibrio splendidus TaxID=29497 RepID=UPI000CC5FDE1|nr:hypothetical protein [Vibrio splendidus]PMH16763.1 hypothetical protein BCU77_22900 [Vibrio splendidus]